jgi:hypothetical protein
MEKPFSTLDFPSFAALRLADQLDSFRLGSSFGSVWNWCVFSLDKPRQSLLFT